MARPSEIYIVATVGGSDGRDKERTLWGQEFATVDVALTEKVLRLEVWPDGVFELRCQQGMRWREADGLDSEVWPVVCKGSIDGGVVVVEGGQSGRMGCQDDG